MTNDRTYEIPTFFAAYAKAALDPEIWLKDHVVDKLSNTINTIVDFGCANGRNFIPFPKEKYRYVGFDVHNYQDIEWKNNVNVEYNSCSLEDFFQEYHRYNIDWKNSLIMCHGTLMYLNNSREQNSFIDLCKSLGCKNFVLHEYGSDQLIRNGNLSEHARNGKLGWLDLNEKNAEMFLSPNGNTFRFRDFENNLCAFISLQK